MSPNEILRFASRCKNPDQAELVWFLQSFAIEEGGSARFAREFKAAFPGIEFSIVSFKGDFLEAAMDFAILTTKENRAETGADHDKLLPHSLRKLQEDERRWESARPAITRSGSENTPLAALVEFMRKYQREAAERFYRTNVGRQVWETLDWSLEERRPCFIEGLEGRGKSASARAWYDAHRSQARYVSLPGLGVQRDFFNSLAVAYGIPCSGAKAPNEVRFRLRDMIARSGLILIIDEAHYCLPERTRAGRPPLIDWIDTELCNAGVAVCLVSTPQFGQRLAEFEARTLWNARQFKRRFSGRWSQLDSKTSDTDLKVLAERIIPGVGVKGIKLAMGCAYNSGRDVSGLFDLIWDAERRARKAGREHVIYSDLREAYELDRVPTENAMARAFKQPGRSPTPNSDAAEPPQDHCDEAAAPAHRREHALSETEFCRRADLGCESKQGAH